MTCRIRPWKVRPTLPCPIMSSLRLSKSRLYQLYSAERRLDIGIEAEGRLALGRQLGEEAGLAHLLGDPGGVLGDLGQRDVGGHRHGAGSLDRGLELPQAPQVGAEHHEAQVGLVAQQGGRDDLVAVGLGRPTAWRRASASKSGGRHVAEEVEHGLPDGGDERGVGGHAEPV